MKKLLSFPMLLGLILSVGSCSSSDDDVLDQGPVLTLAQSEVQVSAEGGSCTVAYKLENPVEGASLTVSPETQEWVSDFTVDEAASTIAFEVAANTANEERSVKVSVSYPRLSEELSFTIVQAGVEPAPFEITIKDVTTSSLTVDVTPRDKEMTYVVFWNTQEYIDKLSLDTDEALHEDDLKYIESTGYSIADFCSTGDLKDKVLSVYPDTEYVVYAYGIDVESGEMLTDIVYAYTTTPAVDKVDARFNIEAEIYSKIADVTVTPENYVGYYFFEAYETASIDPSLSLFEICSNSFNNLVMSYEMFGCAKEDILASCNKGQGFRRIELQAETKYTVVAYAVSEDLLVCSDPSVLEIETSAAVTSKNILEITISNLKARSADVKITTTNEDPYVYVLLDAEDLDEAGESNQEVLDYITSNYYLGYYSIGDEEYSLSKLSPNSKYAVCAFGYLSGTVTTDLFRADFTTPEATVGSVSIEIPCDEYYDIGAIYEIDPSAVSGWDSFYDVYLPLQPILTPEGATADLYYAVYDYESYFDTTSDADLQAEVYYNACYQEPRNPEGSLYTLYYDDTVIALGFAIDEEGNWGPLFKSKPFTITTSGVSDAQQFIDKYVNLYNPQSAPATRAPLLTKASRGERSDLGMTPGVTRRATPAAPKQVTYQGGELKVFRPKCEGMPDFTGTVPEFSRRSLRD